MFSGVCLVYLLLTVFPPLLATQFEKHPEQPVLYMGVLYMYTWARRGGYKANIIGDLPQLSRPGNYGSYSPVRCN